MEEAAQVSTHGWGQSTETQFFLGDMGLLMAGPVPSTLDTERCPRDQKGGSDKAMARPDL